MPNALQGGMPPVPRPDQQPPQTAQAPSFTNALAMPSQASQPPAQQMPAPSHLETVAALRHFMAIIGRLKTLSKDPALGRSDCKMQIIDGMTSLVAERMMSAPQAVAQLGNVPSDPPGQRKWVNQMLQQTISAQNNVLDHHVAAHPATLDWAQESQHQPGSVDDHMQTMTGLGARYQPPT
jgi:hypothetical protein